MSKATVALKHLLLFNAGLLSFKVDQMEPEQFPNVHDKVAQNSLKEVEKFLVQHYGVEGFKTFVGIAKEQFGVVEGEKLTPEAWQDAVTSYKAGKGGVSLASDEDEKSAMKSFYNAAAFADTVVAFAAHLEPTHFKGCEKTEDFLALLPVELKETPATAPEQKGPAPRRGPVATAPVATTEPEEANDAANDAAETEEDDAENEETAVVVAETEGQIMANTNGVKFVADLFDVTDQAIQDSNDAIDTAIDTLQKSRKATMQSFRENRKKVLAKFLTPTTTEA